MRLAWPIKALVSVGSLIGLLWVVPLADIGAAIRSLPLQVFLGAVAVFLLGHLGAASKWRLLASQPARAPYGRWVEAHFTGLFSNLYLPGVAGGDLVRAGWLMRESRDKEAIAAAALADRLIDLVALILLACAGVAAIGTRQANSEWWLLATAAGAVAIVSGVGLILPRLFERSRFPVLRRLSAAAEAVLRRPRYLLTALALSVAIQATFVSLNAWLGVAVGVRPGLSAWLFAWPLAKLVATLPVSIAGIGVREVALVTLLAPFAVPAAAATAVGLAWEAVLISGAVAGWSLVRLRAALAARREVLHR